MKNANASNKRRALRWITVLAVVAVLLCALVISTMAAEEPAGLAKANITLSEDISFTFWATIPEEDVDKATLVFEYKGFTYPAMSGTDAEVKETNEGTFYLFRFDGIAPQNIGETLKGTLYIDGVQAGDSVSTTVADYCRALLENESTKNVAAAILNYGAAAKWYVDDEAEKPTLVDLPTKANMSVIAEKGLDADDGTEDATMNSVGLILSNVISTYFDFATYQENPSFEVTVDGQPRVAKIINNDDGTYRAVIDMKTTELFGKIVATVTDSEGNHISRTATYSVTAYLHKFADSEDEKLATLVRALYAYGLYAHDLDTHELIPIGVYSGKAMEYVCTVCNEHFSYTLSSKAYLEDYSDGGTGAVQPGGNSTLTNVDGALRVVLEDGVASNNADMAFNTSSYVTTMNSVLIAFDAKSAADRETDFAVLLKPNGGWTYQPKTGNSLYITPAGTLKVFNQEVGVTVGTDEFTSIMLNLTVEQDTTDANNTAVFYADLWVDGRYVGQYSTEAAAVTGTTQLDMTASQIQLSCRYSSGKYNEMFLDNVIIADGIDAAGKDLVDFDITLVHDFVETKNVPATCYQKGEIVKVCNACAKSETQIIPTLPHETLSLEVRNGQLVATCATCNANVDGGANWVSEVIKYADGSHNDLTNMPSSVVDGAYEYVGAGSQWQPKYEATAKSPEVATRLGIISIKVKGITTADWTFQLFNRGDNWANATTYAAGTSHGMPMMCFAADGNIYASYSYTNNKQTKIGTLSASEFTTVSVAFSIDVENDTITCDYYVNGTYVTSVEQYNFLYNNTPWGVYSSYSGTDTLYVDDYIFAYTDSAEGFIQHTHDMQDEIVSAATCQKEGVKNSVCSTCGYTEDAAAIPKLAHTLACTGFEAETKKALYECASCHERFAMPVISYDDYADTSYTWTAGDADAASAATNGEFLMVAKSSGNAQFSPNGSILSSTTEGIWGFSLKNTGTRNADFWTQLKVQNATNAWGFNVAATQIRVKADGSIYLGGKDTGLDVSTAEYTDFIVKVTLAVGDSSTTATMDIWIDGVYAGALSASLAVTDATLKNTNSYLQLITGPSASGNQMYYDNLFVADVPSGITSDYVTDGMEVRHNMAVSGIEDNTLVYECVGCTERYGVPLGYADTMSGDQLGFVTSDLDTDYSGIANGAYTLSASQTSGNSNGYIAAYPTGKITSTSSMLLGFDIKNTDYRGTNSDAYFLIQWRTPCTAGNWAFDGNETKLEIKPDGSIYFATKNTDTGLDISKDEFTNILMKATLTVNGENTTLSVDLWVNGIYVATATKTAATTNASWQNASGCGAQLCVQTNKGRNEVILDNLFMADVPASIVAGDHLYNVMPKLHNFTNVQTTEPTCETEGFWTATCQACGYVHEEILPTIPHSTVYTGTLGTYKCTECKTKYVVDTFQAVDFSDGERPGLGNADTEASGVVDGVFGFAALASGAAQSNATFQYTCTQATTNTVIYGFDVKNVADRQAGFTLQWKANTAGTSGWDYSPSKKLTIDAAGNIALGGTATGVQVTTDAFTNLVLTITFVQNGETTDIVQQLWIDGEYITSCTENKAITGLTFASGNTYAQFCLTNNKGFNAIILDNIFFGDPAAEAEGTSLADYLSIAPHAFETVRIEPTCTKNGYVKLVCTDEDCGYEEITEILKATGHDFGSSYVYDNDIHYQECSVCLVRRGTASHVWGEGEVLEQPTCTAVGTMRYSCEYCEATKQEDIEKLPHELDLSADGTFSGTETTASLFGHGTTTYYCSTCSQNIELQTPIHNDFESGVTGPNIVTASYNATLVTEADNTYLQLIANKDGAIDFLTPNISNVDASYKDESGKFAGDRMIFSVRLKTAEDCFLTGGTIFYRTTDGYFSLISWDNTGVLTLPGSEVESGDATNSDDGVELPPIDIIPTVPTIHTDWMELTVIMNLKTGVNEVYINGEYVGTSNANHNDGTYPAPHGSYFCMKFNNTSTANDTGICIDDLTLIYAD